MMTNNQHHTMMKTSIFVSALALVIGCMQQSHAQTFGDQPPQGTITKVGTTSAQFLKIGVGARQIAMGGATVADSRDMSSLYWNPSGLGYMRGAGAQFSHTQYLADINYSYAAVGASLGNAGTIAASLIYLDSGEMNVRTIYEPEGTGERFKTQNMALQLSYGRRLTDRFSIGGSAKYIREQIWHSYASAVALDIGLQFRTPWDRLRIGAVMSNFGPKMKMEGRDILFSMDPSPNGSGNVEIVNAAYYLDEYALPLMFRIGSALRLIETSDHHLVFTADAAHPNDNSEYVNLGAEYSFRNLISFRGGYRNLFEEDGIQGVTYGMGLNLRLDRTTTASVSYAFADFGRLESTHWLTVEVGF